MILAPPRHTKSELASRRFPALYLGKHPTHQIICASYGGDLAGDFGYDVRAIVASPEYRALFDTRLSADKTAANRWNTRQGGRYVSAGIGMQITGRGAHVLVIDDPHKDRDGADSVAERRRVSRWYRSVAYPRLMPGGAVVLILTSWRDDDLAHELLDEAEQGGDQWEVVKLPALAEADDLLGRELGEPLWPEWYGLEALERIRRTIGPREWSAQYQQRPQPEEGEYFKREWIRWYDPEQTPKHLHRYGASDYAVTADGGDYTVHGVVGVDPDDDIYVLDLWREQAAADAWVEAVIDLMARWKPLAWAEEKGQIIKGVGPFLVKRMRERRVYCLRRQYASARDKPTRARAIQGRMSMGKVYLPKGKPWAEELVTELLKFPTGGFDDQVDFLSLIGRMLDRLVPGRVPPEPKPLVVRPPTLDELIALQPKADPDGGRRI